MDMQQWRVINKKVIMTIVIMVFLELPLPWWERVRERGEF